MLCPGVAIASFPAVLHTHSLIERDCEALRRGGATVTHARLTLPAEFGLLFRSIPQLSAHLLLAGSGTTAASRHESAGAPVPVGSSAQRASRTALGTARTVDASDAVRSDADGDVVTDGGTAGAVALGVEPDAGNTSREQRTSLTGRSAAPTTGLTATLLRAGSFDSQAAPQTGDAADALTVDTARAPARAGAATAPAAGAPPSASPVQRSTSASSRRTSTGQQARDTSLEDSARADGAAVAPPAQSPSAAQQAAATTPHAAATSTQGNAATEGTSGPAGPGGQRSKKKPPFALAATGAAGGSRGATSATAAAALGGSRGQLRLPPSIAAATPTAYGPPPDEATLGVRKRELQAVHRRLVRDKFNDVFGQPVSEDDAPGYSEVVSDPMDYSTLGALIDSGAVSWVRQGLCQCACARVSVG